MSRRELKMKFIELLIRLDAGEMITISKHCEFYSALRYVEEYIIPSDESKPPGKRLRSRI